MTKVEAEIVAKLIGFADHGCSNCVDDLVNHANRLFPKFTFIVNDGPDARDTYLNQYGIECTGSYIPVTVEPRQ